MDKNQPKRTVKKKFLRVDKIGKGVKGVGKPVAAIGAFIGATYLKEALASKDEDSDSDDD